jgi:GT2 family glycosyltransferase
MVGMSSVGYSDRLEVSSRGMRNVRKGVIETDSERPARANAAARFDMSEPHPLVSVIIPIHGDAGALETCLDCLDGQTYPPHRLEIVVIDNGSDRDLRAAVGRRRAVRLVDCAEPGSYAARNRGVATARGTVLAFTDADCQPREDWLESGVAALRREPNVAVLGGHIEMASPRQDAGTSAAALHQRVSAFQQKRYVELEGYAATANLFTYKRLFEDIGPFDERLYSGGDLEWGQRAQALGYRLAFCAEAVTVHPARTTMRTLLGKVKRVTGGHFTMRRLRGQGHFAAVVQTVRRAVRRTAGDGPHRALRGWDMVRFVAVEWAIAATVLSEVLRLMSGGRPRRR